MQWDTIKWWLGQEEAARKHFQSEETISIKQALGNLAAADWKSIKGLWAHGVTFDVTILDNAFKRCGMKTPWHFKLARDTRTLFWLEKPVWPDNPVKHSAEQDAIAQAGAVVDSLRKIGAAKVEL